MSIEVETEQSTPAEIDTPAATAKSSRTALKAWRRRRYQVAGLLVGAALVGAIVGNSFLASQYSPAGAVRQYVSALQAGDSSTAWRLLQVTAPDGTTINLIDRSALTAALSNRRPDIGNFTVTNTTSIDASTAAVTIAYSTSIGTKDTTLVVRRAAENNFAIYPKWQIAVSPVVLTISQPAGSGGVMVDGKALAINGSAKVAVLPMAHIVRFAGTSMVEPKTVILEGFASSGLSATYAPTLTPAGATAATEAVKAAFDECAKLTLSRPTGCPQSGDADPSLSVQWHLIGDPTRDLSFAVDSRGTMVATGHFQMVVAYPASKGGGHRPSSGGYQASLVLGPDSVSVSSIQAVSSLPGVPRPPAATDDLVGSRVAQGLRDCATVTSGSPSDCPQLYFFPEVSVYHWTLVTDPLLNMSVSRTTAVPRISSYGSFARRGFWVCQTRPLGIHEPLRLLQVMVEMPSVDELAEFALAPVYVETDSKGRSYSEILELLKANPQVALERFKELLRWPQPSVRVWACYSGARACGHLIVPTLLETFKDRSHDVQESVIDGLDLIEPSHELLRPLLPALRRRLLTWDEGAAFRIARLMAILNDTDAIPALAHYVRRQDIDIVARMLGNAYLIYLRQGVGGLLSRIRNHQDHALMPALCRVGFAIGTPDVYPALEQLAATSPDTRCRALAEQTLAALDAASSKGPPPYWEVPLDFTLPKVAN